MAYLLPHLIRDAAMRSPDHEAMRSRDESLSYAELYTRSSQLAHALIADGVEPGERVGILLNKGLDSAVALYGIMLAGGAYVPLDPFAPAARSGFVIRDCGIERIVTGSAKLAVIRELRQHDVELRSIFGVGADEASPHHSVSWEEISSYPGEPPTIPTTEQDLCYILYTSGSTGTPKGIMHSHRSALAWADIAASSYRLGSDDVISNYAPLHFDLSTLDYFGSARAGATTVVIPEEYTKFPASLAGLIADERLTVFYTVPMALIQLAQPGILEDRDLSRLRLVLFGGEPMPIKHLRRIMTLIPHAEFVNVYGPTEVNGCTHYPVPSIPLAGADPLPIGLPYPNVEAIVVDEVGEEVPAGEPGELLIRTPTMMRGYWGRDDLNEGAFFTRQRYSGLPDVFHRTGDLVRTRPDGTLDFLGRRDRQVKSRGYRVELDEVEAALLAHEGVREGAVYAVPDADGSLELRGEVIPADGWDLDPDEVARHLRSLLPPYAVPARVTLCTTFPRTSSGKIDRRTMQERAAADSVLSGA